MKGLSLRWRNEPNLEDLITRAEQARDELRATIRDAHGARSDLKLIIKAAKDDIAGGITQHIDNVVKNGLAAYQESLTRAIQRSRASVYRKFDQMINILVNPRDERIQALFRAVEVTNILEALGPECITDPEAAALYIGMKADPSTATAARLGRLAELLRPLIEETDEEQ